MPQRFCPNCGHRYAFADDARPPRFCSDCGETLTSPQPAETALLATVVEPHTSEPEVPAPRAPAPRALNRLATSKNGSRWRTLAAETKPTPAEVVEPEPPPLTQAAEPVAFTRAALATSPPVEPAATLASDEGPPARRSNALYDWVGFFASTIVHTVAFIVLSLLFIEPEEKALLEIVSAPQTIEELAIDKIQPVDVELEIDAVAQDITDHEELQAQLEETTLDAPDDLAGEGELDTAGQFALPEGLFATLPGAGRGGTLATSAPEFAKRLTRAGAKSGAVQISLIWNNHNDLDLHVVTPGGERIFFDYRRSRCRGELDVDMNAEGPVTDEPVENVYWPARSAPLGEFLVIVHHYANHGDRDPTPFEVLVQVDGKVEKFRGELSYSDAPVLVHRFERNSDDDFYVE